MKLSTSTLIASAFATTCGVTHGDMIEWKIPANGTFQVATSWDPAMVPGKMDQARFDLAGAYTVSFSDTIAPRTPINEIVSVTKGTVTFDLNGNAYVLTGSGGATGAGLSIGALNLATHPELIVTDGQLRPNIVLVGNLRNGTLRVSTGAGVIVRDFMNLDSEDGQASVIVEHGAFLTTKGMTFVGRPHNGGAPTSKVTVTGRAGNTPSRWRSFGDIIVGEPRDEFNSDDGVGAIIAEKGGVVVAKGAGAQGALKTITIGPKGALQGGDAITGTRKHVKAKDVRNSGTIKPGGGEAGDAIGQLGIEGDLVHESEGVLDVRIDGPGRGIGYDALDVFGHTDLFGMLEVALDPGFIPVQGEVFRILTADSLSGEFDALPDSSVFNVDGQDFKIRYLSAAPRPSVVLKAVPAPGAMGLLGCGGVMLALRRRRDCAE